MSYVIQLVQGRALKLTQVRADVLRIGRGTNADVRSDNPAVAFEHAIIEKDSGGYYTIIDKGSITGTYVNRKPVEQQRLGKGDVIEVGDLRIEVQVADTTKPLFLRQLSSRRQAAAPGYADVGEDTGSGYQAEAGTGTIAAEKVDYVDAYALRRPWLHKSTVASILLIIALGVVGEVTQEDKQSVFMPGGVSSAHSRARDAQGNSIAERCAACHTPWKSITDDKCAQCHAMAPHATHELKAPACFTCHSEHRGLARLAAIPDVRCNECHKDLSKHVKTSPDELAKLRFADGRYSFAEIQKINAFGDVHPEFVFPADTNTLKFNHKLHLAPNGVFNATGRREVLACNDCHNLVDVRGKVDPVQLQFDTHCQRCHKLTFDPRFPRAEAPHGGDPGLVYGFVLATYAGNTELAGKSAVEVRRLLSQRQVVAPDQRALLNAEQVIKTKCDKCHDLERRGPNNQLAAVPPKIPTTWFAASDFEHGAHKQISCEQCHDKVRQSVPTSDVHMPTREDCTECHGTKAAPGVKQTSSACVACHDYHLRTDQTKPIVLAAGLAGTAGPAGALLDPASGGRMLQTILIAAIIVLLFVVFIPLGAALYQRLKPSRTATPRGAAPAKGPTVKVPPMSAPPMQAPSAPAEPPQRASAPRPPAEAAPTQMLNLDAIKPPASGPVAGGATEMLQWYGMLRCTSGPLDGQNFIIEEDGFYIGRDSTMSKVVINDGRVSKRHVKIQPRNGKVFAIDEGSTNGTFLTAGGQRITEHQLKRGDTLILADNAATFVYQI
ncbi:MAG TPA: FHA domain-containing protein [Thermoanaerobaculia bacterium]|nr:FHA domain-containing protein [Thermoanaerobaculia bacterium]